VQITKEQRGSFFDPFITVKKKGEEERKKKRERGRAEKTIRTTQSKARKTQRQGR
jgi:hypothetical protein